ncbi:MAG TPA: hypothetical protein H9935_06455 [Candidatus Blautia merdigallinarum]|uniref:Phage-like element PBSX protein XkdF domain-containing protein n=1 Tax=Candidatus Blautia merdigallinarum TaxID=2838495 RepID=A0A9D2N4H7_9FIRM|nr:hypothetical protein [Candidatus Blautia merdigallinarum]
MPGKIAKSYAISDAKISFVSLVDKAANKREFLITKSQDGKADFRTYGRIVKADADSHFVTGIVYEPMVEDTDGNYMTEDEITKAAHWFMKNAGDADIQHCFEKAEGVEVVESYVAKSDMEIEGQQIKKGTWLMTMEVTNGEVWDSIKKGDITGFSMGGKGSYSTKDIDISDPDNPVEKAGGKKGILKALASMFGMDVVEKGAVKEKYKKRIVSDNFWTAYYSLSDYLLETYNPATGTYEPVHDETVIRDALADFNEIIVGLLADGDGVYKAIEKAGKKLSTENKNTLKGIYENLGTFLSKFEEVEDEEVTKSEIESIVIGAVQKAMSAGEAGMPANGSIDSEGNVIKDGAAMNGAQGYTGVKKAKEKKEDKEEEEITEEKINKMVQEAIQKQMQPQEETLTMENVEQMISESVAKAMEPILKSTGIPTNMNDVVQKGSGEEQHYLHGFI